MRLHAWLLPLLFGLVLAGMPPGRVAWAASPGIQKIQHIVMIMQENRSFDHYFGTFPGAAGYPMKDGAFSVCVPDPLHRTCIYPWHNSDLATTGGPHGVLTFATNFHDGKMDGFIRSFETCQQGGTGCETTASPVCTVPESTYCVKNARNLVSYFTDRDLPNYWSYARNFVLQDHMFQSDKGWSAVEHVAAVSGWSASCLRHNAPMSCVPDQVLKQSARNVRVFAWTDITWLLYRAGVSWGFYVVDGTEPDCANPNAMSCVAGQQSAATPSYWNPLPDFDDVQQDGQVGNVQSVSHFFTAARAGTLPQVVWIVPSAPVSEHPGGGNSVLDGQAYVTGLINAVMSGPNWNSTAIFVTWDDFGGYYDHMPPPQVDKVGYGFRVPGLLISPYARKGYIDHQVLSFDAYLKFIEDRFLGGDRLDPKTDGRPDPRPDVRENAKVLGDLSTEFDFTQAPRKPLILPTYPGTGAARPHSHSYDVGARSIDDD